MRAAWYERRGPAVDVLQVGEMPAPEPAAGEVRVRVALSGVNPGDTKKRGDWLGYGMPFAWPWWTAAGSHEPDPGVTVYQWKNAGSARARSRWRRERG